MCVQIDWGGQFQSFSTYFQHDSIIHEILCPYAHHQNGVVERKYRHITETSLSLLDKSNLPQCFWEDAFTIAVYLINRLLSNSISQQVPLTKLFGKVPGYSFLKPLAAHVFLHCVFIGYSADHKGYKCSAPIGKVFISRDVVFDEFEFPSFGKTSYALSPLFSSNTNMHSATPPIVKNNIHAFDVQTQ